MKSKENGNHHPESQRKTNSSFDYGSLWLALLGGLVAAFVGSSAIYLYQQEHQTPPGVPTIKFHQCLTLGILTFLLLAVFVYDLLRVRLLLSMNVPLIRSSVPFIGMGIQFIFMNPWDKIMSWHKQTDSEAVCFEVLGRYVMSVAGPTYLKKVLQIKIASVKKDVGFTYAPFLVILGNGIVTAENKEWLSQRLKMSMPLRVDVLEKIPAITLGAVQRLMVQMDAAAASGEPFELAEALRHLTLQVISETFLSISSHVSDEVLANLYLPIVEECNTRIYHPYRSYLFFLPFFWKHQWSVYQLNKFVSGLFRKRWNQRQEPDHVKRNDIMDVLLDAYEKHHPEAKTLTSPALKQLCDEMKTFLLAGHETSAAMMTWTLYELMASEKLMTRVRTEADTVFDKKTDWTAVSTVPPPLPTLSNLVVGQACLKESLRKYTVVPIVVRQTVDDIDLGDGEFMPKGTTIFANIQALHHNATYWPDPMNYCPDRFLSGKVEPYTFLPFIAGPRNCLGQYLSLLESKMVVGMLTNRYQFDPLETLQTQLHGENDPRHRYVVPVSVKQDLMVKITKRK